MNAIFAIARKDLTLAVRDRAGLFFMLFFPIAMGIFFGAINGGIARKPAVLKLMIVDEDRSARSEEFIQTILRTNEQIVIQEGTREQAVAAVRRGAVAGAIVLPAGFGDSMGLFGTGAVPRVEVGVDPTRTAEAGLLQGILLQAAGETTFGSMRSPQRLREMMERARGELAGSSDVPLPVKLALSTLYGSLDGLADRMEEQAAASESTEADGNEQASGPSMQLLDIQTLSLARSPGLVDRVRSGWDLSIPAASLWAVLGCVATFAQSLVRERTRGTLLRLQIAPLSRGHLLAGKALATWVMAVSVMGAMMIIGAGLGMRPKDPVQLVVSIACVAVAFVGVMMAMSVIGRTEEAVAGAGWGANVIMAMVGGGMIPLAFLPGWMQSISHFSPVKWGVLSLEGAVWREFTWSEALMPWSVLLGIGVVGFLVGVWRISKMD